MTRSHSTGLLMAAAVAAYALYSPMQAFEHGQISAMPQTCQSRMNDIFDSYYNITVLDGTFNCTDVILSNLNNTKGVNCSKPEDVRACFNVSLFLCLLTQAFLSADIAPQQACSFLQELPQGMQPLVISCSARHILSNSLMTTH